MSNAGWHPDPSGRHELRYFDGASWTDQVSTGGQAGVDPLASAPPGGGAGAPMGGGVGGTVPGAAGGVAPGTGGWGQAGAQGGFGGAPYMGNPASGPSGSAGSFGAVAKSLPSVDQLKKMNLAGGLVAGGFLVGVIGLFFSWATVTAFSSVGISIGIDGIRTGDGKLFLVGLLAVAGLVFARLRADNQGVRIGLVANGGVLLLLAGYEFLNIHHAVSGAGHVGFGLYLDTAAALAILGGALMAMKGEFFNP